MRRFRRTTFGTLLLAVLAGVMIAPLPSVEARPVYFDAYTTRYGFIEGDQLYACGVCHYLWEGTGARNLYGQSIEQQLYVGKTIQQSLADAEDADPDADGFTSLEEIGTHLTLPGYNCTNFQQAIGAPLGYDTYITPGVASCLEPIDIRVTPSAIALAGATGSTTTADITVFNNGTDDDIIVTAYGFLIGDPSLSIVAPSAPITIPVGQSQVLELQFNSAVPAFLNDTVRIESNDPDEGIIDIPVTAVAVSRNLAPASFRSACFKQVDNAYRKYVKTQQRLWSDCYAQEVGGFACNAGDRDLRLDNAELRLRSRVGGNKDKSCVPEGITPSTLGLGATCGGGCESILLMSFDDYADCLVCRADAARDDLLTASVGTIPPDLPLNTAATGGAAICQDRLASGTVKSTLKIQKTLSRCELGNVTSDSPVDCAVDQVDKIDKARAKTDEQVAKCSDTAGLQGCLFDEMPVASCLGDTAFSTAEDLVNATFGLDP